MPRRAAQLYPHLVLDPDIQPVSRRIVEAIKAGIRSGGLVDGDQLPATRRFAESYQVSRSAVVEAYEMLGGLGLITAQRGSGTRISPGAVALLGLRPRQSMSAEGDGPRNLPQPINLTVPGGGGRQVINRRDWNRAWRQATDPFDATPGTQRLSEALHNHLRSFRGLVCTPEQIILRPGIGSVMADIVYGLDLAGHSVVIEDPSYPRIQRHLVNEGCRVRRVPVDDQGLRIDMLSAADKVVHVTPARQWPTGVAMSPQRRHELLAWSARTGGVIVENDLDAEFTFGQAPQPTLLAAAPPGARVLYLGSSAKLITPELTLVWLIVSEPFKRRAADMAAVSDYPARALAHYISSGAMYRHRNRALALFQERRGALLRALARYVPRVQHSGDPSGTELVLRLPSGVDEVGVQLRLEDAGYRVSTIGDFAMRTHPAALLLQYAELTPTQARGFAQALAQALR